MTQKRKFERKTGELEHKNHFLKYKRGGLLGGLALIIGFFIFCVVSPPERIAWTGLKKDQEKSIAEKTIVDGKEITITTKEIAGKNLWDWMGLLGVPVVLFSLGAWFQQLEKTRQDNNYKDEVLKDYLDSMQELLLEKNLKNSQEEEDIRAVARTRTLTVFERLVDSPRKTVVAQFLLGTRLIQIEKASEEDVGDSKQQIEQHPVISLKGTDLNGADFNRANLNGADFNRANLIGANFISAKLTGADLSDAQLQGVNLSGATLTSANLSFATLSRRAKLRSAVLKEAVLKGAELNGADLSNANLSGADLSNAILIGANLRSANLSNAILVDANLSSADLSNAILIGADLRGANLNGAVLSGADLIGANLSSAVLRGVKFSFAKLSFINFVGIDLSNSDFSNAILNGADLENVQLSNAKLNQANLSDANLKGADLKGATLKGAILLGANLGTSQHLDQKQLTQKSNPPLLCATELPFGMGYLSHRDCGLLPQVLLQRYPQIFETLQTAKKRVESSLRQFQAGSTMSTPSPTHQNREASGAE